jgi:transposase
LDEHGAEGPHARLGLKPILRKVWARRGCRPIARGQHRYQWLYIYGFVRPTTGAVVWFLADTVNTALFSAILASFAAEVGAGPDKPVLLVIDGAGWHVAADLHVPEGLELHVLPAYSPELQPAECLWPLTREAVANRHFETLDDLNNVVARRCLILAEDPDRIQAETLFHWWPAFT